MENHDKYIGKMLDNRYEILEKLGTGGMAVVYKARCHRLNRLVAIKILKEELAEDEEFRRRFRTESQAVAMMSHPNIVNVYDVSRSGNIEYIVMELIDGITLKQYINRKGLLNWKETLHFTTQIVKALSHAHSRGIIHRDIKPHNIMILKDGSVKVADFGIARLLSSQNTLTQEALGSVHYISPEQAKGAPVDERTDLYSVGVVMYEMLTSRLPFVGDSAVSIAIQHISAIPLMPREINPDVPIGLEEIAMHAMEANPDNRYRNAEEMLKDLDDFRKNPAVIFGYSVLSGLSEHTPNMPVKQNERREPPIKTPGRKSAETTKEEYKAGKKRSRKTGLLVGILVVILFIVGLFMFIWNFFLKDMFDPELVPVTIPKFEGEMWSAVRDDPEYKELYNFSVEYKNSNEYDEGYIIEQYPQPDRQQSVSDGKINVQLTVSSGEEQKTLMPKVTGIDYREASINLKNLDVNLVINTEGQYDDNVTENYVISQIPEEGRELTDGMTVYLTYSLGPEEKLTTVPDVVGVSMQTAISRLEAKDLLYKPTYVDSDQPIDQVVFQSYDPGEEVPIKTTVVIQVSNGALIPKPEPEPEPEPEQPPEGQEPTDPGDTTENGENGGLDIFG